jgi:hypothetical protein
MGGYYLNESKKLIRARRPCSPGWLKEKVHLEHLGVDGWVVFKLIEELNKRAWDIFVRLVVKAVCEQL